nr:putative exostosin-like protein [Tanacetum cinerariifolium]
TKVSLVYLLQLCLVSSPLTSNYINLESNISAAWLVGGSGNGDDPEEAPVNFLTDPLEGKSTLRPADILVFGWAGGKHACVDLTGVSPLVGFRENEFVAGQDALKAESSKVAKHEKACLENQHVFIPFAFDTFGFLAPETEKFLNRVQRVVQSNCSTPKAQNFIFSRIGFAIQKGVTAQLVARLPAILL